ncbi:COP9 signalosome complex subunit 9 isoform X1 [Opisthocomus hoazin]|uniref:COP9 signalosome complex subunit 9 isoform X1 n=1 Tax=Opisthocomus hoazin TaxID=30419 RepID=UPI003F537299
MKPAVDEMFPEGAGPYVDLDEAGGSTGLLMDLAANEKAVHADFFNENSNSANTRKSVDRASQTASGSCCFMDGSLISEGTHAYLSTVKHNFCF